MPETNRVPRLEAPAPRPRKYAFFRFQTGKRLASAYGCCSGQVDRRTAPGIHYLFLWDPGGGALGLGLLQWFRQRRL